MTFEEAPELGAHALDKQVAADSWALRHLTKAMDTTSESNPQSITVGELLAQGGENFKDAPHPGAMLVAQREQHQQTPAPYEHRRLNVLSYNTGLLSRWYPFKHVEVPYYQQRRLVLPRVIFEDGWDILMLQEVWDMHDAEYMQRIGEHFEYEVYIGSPRHHAQHGLVIAVRSDLIKQGSSTQLETLFDDYAVKERFPGPNVHRGFLSWSFELEGSETSLSLFNSHLQSFPENSRLRDLQSRQLGLAVSSIADDSTVFVAGDMNTAPYYPFDSFGTVGDAPVEGWFSNATAYPLLLHYGGLFDSYAAVHGDDDVLALDLLGEYTQDWNTTPLGPNNDCKTVRGRVFSASDCNNLYFEQYAGTEYPARLDYIFWRDSQQDVRVLSSDLVYIDPIEIGDAGFVELSDHYGVSTSFALPQVIKKGAPK